MPVYKEEIPSKYRLLQSEHSESGEEEAVSSDTLGIEDIYILIGLGKAQYFYWFILAMIAFLDSAQLHVIATIAPVLRCEWEMDVKWETLINVSVYLFSAVGGLMFTKLPDVYGRKQIMAINIAVLLLFSSLSAFAQNKIQFLILRSVVGICTGITFPTCVSFTAEIVRSSNRETGPSIVLLFANFGIFFLAVITYFLLQPYGWRWLVLFISLPLSLCWVSLVFFIPESPRFLVVTDRRQEAIHAFKRMAKLNGASFPEKIKIVGKFEQESESTSELMKSGFLKETILLSIMFFGNLLIKFGTVLFYPLALYSGFCGGSHDQPSDHNCIKIDHGSLVELAIATSSCVFAIGSGYVAAKKLGRSISLKIFSTASFIATLFLFKCFSNTVTVGLFFLVKLLTNSHNLVTNIIVPELYPTSFRSTAVGFTSGCGKVGALVSTGTVYALYYYDSNCAVALFAVSAMFVTIASWIWDKETTESVISDVLVEE